MGMKKKYEIEIEFLSSKIKRTKEEQEAIRRKSVRVLVDSLILNGVIDLHQFNDDNEKRGEIIK